LAAKIAATAISVAIASAPLIDGRTSEARGAKQAVDGRRYRGHVSLLYPNPRCFQPSNGRLVGIREAG
jgi:hypothetical protein